MLHCKVEMTGADFLRATQEFAEELTETQVRRLREQMEEARFDMEETGLRVFDERAAYYDEDTSLSTAVSELVEMVVKTLVSLHVKFSAQHPFPQSQRLEFCRRNRIS